jgi:F0F1-type ATP synthase membrane subunit c/vacuolar-type H+-ATPase subunit K
LFAAAQRDWEASGAGLGMGFSAFAGYMQGLANNFTLGSDTHDLVMFLETLLGSAKLLYVLSTTP